MTPERAAYHRLMLLSGLPEEYEQELGIDIDHIGIGGDSAGSTLAFGVLKVYI